MALYDETTMGATPGNFNPGRSLATVASDALAKKCWKQPIGSGIALEEASALEQNLPAGFPNTGLNYHRLGLVYFGYLKHEQVTTGLRINSFYKLISCRPQWQHEMDLYDGA